MEATSGGPRNGYPFTSGYCGSQFFAFFDALDGNRADRLAKARLVEDLPSPGSGYVASLDAREVGITSMLLGGGRAKKTDKIDHTVGIVLHAKVGDWVDEGQPLLSIHANAEARLSGARQRLLAAYGWSDDPVSGGSLIHRLVT